MTGLLNYKTTQTSEVFDPGMINGKVDSGFWPDVLFSYKDDGMPEIPKKMEGN